MGHRNDGSAVWCKRCDWRLNVEYLLFQECNLDFWFNANAVAHHRASSEEVPFRRNWNPGGWAGCWMSLRNPYNKPGGISLVKLNWNERDGWMDENELRKEWQKLSVNSCSIHCKTFCTLGTPSSPTVNVPDSIHSISICTVQPATTTTTKWQPVLFTSLNSIQSSSDLILSRLNYCRASCIRTERSQCNWWLAGWLRGRRSTVQ